MAENKTHWKKLQDNNYIGEWMFDGTDKDIILTIKSVAREEVFVPEANSTAKERVITFAEIPQKLICNTTNAQRISKAVGSEFIEDWVDKRIALYFDKTVKFGREVVGGIRVRPTAPHAPVCTDCGNDIKPDSGRSAEWLADYTKKKYGRELCADCARKAAQKQ